MFLALINLEMKTKVFLCRLEIFQGKKSQPLKCLKGIDLLDRLGNPPSG